MASTRYLGVGRITGRAVQLADFKVTGSNGEAPALDILITQGAYHREFVTDPERSEWFVPVKWLKVVPIDKALKEIAFFENQNTVSKPTTPKWLRTINRLKERFGIF